MTATTTTNDVSIRLSLCLDCAPRSLPHMQCSGTRQSIQDDLAFSHKRYRYTLPARTAYVPSKRYWKTTTDFLMRAHGHQCLTLQLDRIRDQMGPPTVALDDCDVTQTANDTMNPAFRSWPLAQHRHSSSGMIHHKHPFFSPCGPGLVQSTSSQARASYTA
ncbi:hypothetical protein LY76DRAFT_124752 [Colletotrichum caudatum]|nr:hypothetical protein LY76DRAFT_124752 [Colletotrichum caudatum]